MVANFSELKERRLRRRRFFRHLPKRKNPARRPGSAMRKGAVHLFGGGLKGGRIVATGLAVLATGSLGLAATRAARTGGSAATRCTAGGRRSAFFFERHFRGRSLDDRLRAGAIDDGFFNGDSGGNRSLLLFAMSAFVVVIPVETIAIIVIVAVAAIVAVFTRSALLHLRLRGSDDAVIVLGVLEVVFRDDAVTGALGVAGQGCIFFCNMLGRAPDFHIRTRTVISSRQRITALAVVVVVIVIIVVVVITPAAALVLLSWPHMSLT
jgi:hypothetical protein